jgi:hypothetical protein
MFSTIQMAGASSSDASAAKVSRPFIASSPPQLPAPASGAYELTFDQPVKRAVPGDFDGNGLLDFAIKSAFSGPKNTMKIEARLQDGTRLWWFDTSVTPQISHNELDVPMTAWDFDGDGEWEVYFQYYDSANGGWRHRIVAGSTGEILADADFPYDWNDRKSMIAIAYRGEEPKLVANLDLWDRGRIWMFETWTGSAWSLDPMWRYDRSRGVAHDMFRTADVDQDGSDDEILAGCVVLNADGSLRYDVATQIGASCGNADSTHLGFYSAARPDELVHVTGDGEGKHIVALWARTGEVLWSYDMRSYFPNWTHFHSGWLADLRPEVPGAELLAIDRNTPAWAYIRVADGEIMAMGESSQGQPPCRGTFPTLWDEDEYYECVEGVDDALDGRGDIGGPGCEEIWGLSNPNTLRISFNPSCPAEVPSRWANRHYRQDVALFSSGYAPYYINPLVLGEGDSSPTFADVPRDHWAYDEIEALYRAGYIAGCSSDPLRYCPESAMTRAESAVFVERGIHTAGYLPSQPGERVFEDVPLEEWYAKWVTALWDDGYTAGCSTDPQLYCPMAEHDRIEGSVFFLRMLHGPDFQPPPAQGIFSDVDADGWGARWAEAAYAEGLLPACKTDPDLFFCPQDALTRAMAAYMMVQAKGLSIP